jgi:hypothetical protein
MNSLIRSLIIVSLLIFSAKLFSQETFNDLDKAYGLDPLIHNGKKYTYFLPAGTGGTQFIYSPDFIQGEVMMQGGGEAGMRGSGEYLLNYDVYNQKLLLKFLDESGAFQIIEVSEAWLHGFRLGDTKFGVISFKGENRIYQVLGDEKYKVLYHWRKSLKLGNSTSNASYTFSPPAKSRFVSVDGNLGSYSSNGSFIKNFDPGLKDHIRDYLKDHDIKVKNATDQSMAELINYISNL